VLRLSVILATYNRAALLPRVLGCLADQTLSGASYEIIVIDDASPDNTREVVAELAAAMPCETRYLTHSENRGPGFTQNKGIREARAQLLLLLADDILLSPTALAAHLRCHEQHPGDNIAILGDGIPYRDAQTSIFMRNYDPFNVAPRCEGNSELPYWMFGAFNISLSTRFMREHGMFLEHRGRAGAPAMEDTELGFRLLRSGLRIYFCRDAVGHHHHDYTLESAAERMYVRGLNWEEFRARMPDSAILTVTHLLTQNTFLEYRRVLHDNNLFVGWERWFAWHVLRECVRRIVFSGFIVNRFWKVLFARAEADTRLARLMRPWFYNGFLHYFFVRGVHDARRIGAGEGEAAVRQ
jgi:glycosyltransferase involved in cell wall biosynthesis